MGNVNVPAGFQTAVVRGLCASVLMIGPAILLQARGDSAVVRLSPATLELHNVTAVASVYRGRNAIQVADAREAGVDDDGRFAVIPSSTLNNGQIDIALTGDTTTDADASARGFVGIAFHVSEDRARYDCIYLRPKNARAEDQLRRNHSTQYMSIPSFPWRKLRSESPGQYESYVDLEPGAWTTIRIDINNTTAKLYVNGAKQPALIVSDVKRPNDTGAVALWIGPGTIAHFADLRIRRIP